MKHQYAALVTAARRLERSRPTTKRIHKTKNTCILSYTGVFLAPQVGLALTGHGGKTTIQVIFFIRLSSPFVKNEQNKRQDIYVIGLAASGHGLKTVHRTVFLTAFRRRFAPPHQLHRDGITVIDSSSNLRNKKKKQVF